MELLLAMIPAFFQSKDLDALQTVKNGRYHACPLSKSGSESDSVCGVSYWKVPRELRCGTRLECTREPLMLLLDTKLHYNRSQKIQIFRSCFEKQDFLYLVIAMGLCIHQYEFVATVSPSRSHYIDYKGRWTRKGRTRSTSK